ncbi:hypothetical protein Tco_1455480 [Tanacetum coccineum]
MSELSDDAIGSISLSWVLWVLIRSLLSRCFIGLCRYIRAISDAMVWRHPDAAIDDPRSAASSFSMADVRRLSAHVIKLRDMSEVMGIYDFLCLPKWTGAEVQEEPHLDVRSTLQKFPFYCTPHAAIDKRKASTSGATSSHVAKRTRSALAQSSDSTTCPSLFVGESDDESDGDDDACVEIPLVTPLRSLAMIPSLGNQGQSSTAPAIEGSNTRG